MDAKDGISAYIAYFERRGPQPYRRSAPVYEDCPYDVRSPEYIDWLAALDPELPERRLSGKKKRVSMEPIHCANTSTEPDATINSRKRKSCTVM